jgi:LmbE family N-acetylglucosaminyl deacetylase
MNSLRRRGAAVTLLSAFAGQPESTGRLSYWDAKRGTSSKAEALAMRRAEDDSAAALLGLTSVQLPFDDFAYVPARDPDALWDSIVPHLPGVDVVLLPGWPLLHPDHRYLTMLAMQRLDAEQLFFYEELPYGAQPVQVVKRLLRGRRTPSIVYELGTDVTWQRTVTSRDDFAAKRRAVECYGGELAALGRHAKFGDLHDRIWRREMVATTNTLAAAEFLFGADR